MYNPFTKHPKEVNETYFQHMRCALGFHFTLLRLSMCALIHAIFPFLCITTASDGIKELNDCMQYRKKNGNSKSKKRDDKWLIDQYNRHRVGKDTVKTIEEMKKAIEDAWEKKND